MNPFNNSNNTIEQLLARFTGPVRAVRTRLFVRNKGAERVVQDTEDRTEIGPSGGIETMVSHEAHFHDCGHFAADNLGGRCECGALVCKECLTHCSRCGAALCPKHQKKLDAESEEILCPPCHHDAVTKRRVKKVAATVTSFFGKRKRRHEADSE